MKRALNSLIPLATFRLGFVDNYSVLRTPKNEQRGENLKILPHVSAVSKSLSLCVIQNQN